MKLALRRMAVTWTEIYIKLSPLIPSPLRVVSCYGKPSIHHTTMWHSNSSPTTIDILVSFQISHHASCKFPVKICMWKCCTLQWLLLKALNTFTALHHAVYCTFNNIGLAITACLFCLYKSMDHISTFQSIQETSNQLLMHLYSPLPTSLKIPLRISHLEGRASVSLYSGGLTWNRILVWSLTSKYTLDRNDQMIKTGEDRSEWNCSEVLILMFLNPPISTKSFTARSH
jgi:hypothetical protein